MLVGLFWGLVRLWIQPGEVFSAFSLGLTLVLFSAGLSGANKVQTVPLPALWPAVFCPHSCFRFP